MKEADGRLPSVGRNRLRPTPKIIVRPFAIVKHKQTFVWQNASKVQKNGL